MEDENNTNIVLASQTGIEPRERQSKVLEEILKGSGGKLQIVPKHPFFRRLESFGLSEFGAFGFNVGGTYLVDYLNLINSADTSYIAQAARTLAGPIIEKGGFLGMVPIKAIIDYAKTPEFQRDKKNYNHHLRNNLGELKEDLATDISVHDPSYVVLMVTFMNSFPDVPPAACSAAAFVGAVVLGAGAQTAYDYISSARLKGKLRRAGFEKELPYYEARIIVDSSDIADNMLNELSKKFDLCEQKKYTYNDIYLPTKLTSRICTVKTRLRERENRDTHKKTNSAQVILTRAELIKQGKSRRLVKSEEETPGSLFTSTLKEKHYFQHTNETVTCLNELPEGGVQEFLLKYKDEDSCTYIEFDRETASSGREGLLITKDGSREHYVGECGSSSSLTSVETRREYTVLELKMYRRLPGTKKWKTRKNLFLYALEEALKIGGSHCLPTTYGKLEIAQAQGYGHEQ